MCLKVAHRSKVSINLFSEAFKNGKTNKFVRSIGSIDGLVWFGRCLQILHSSRWRFHKVLIQSRRCSSYQALIISGFISSWLITLKKHTHQSLLDIISIKDHDFTCMFPEGFPEGDLSAGRGAVTVHSYSNRWRTKITLASHQNHIN